MQKSAGGCIFISQGGELNMKRLTSSVYSFEKIINEGKLYVDKTEFIWNLIQDDGSYFLARPRRFGKSLTISTLEAVFQGRKDLFKGLAIYDKPYDWKKYPVIHLDFANCMAQTADELEDFIFDKLTMIAAQFGLELQGLSNPTRFEKLIGDLSKQNPVVVLVDEYDKPILNNAMSPNVADILSALKAFYSTIKIGDGKERFAFITGVSKFSHVSLFSGMNNPTDLTMSSRYATLLGYTQTEFETYFDEYIDYAMLKLNLGREEFLQKMKDWYDGYRFSKNAESVYNPVSVAKFFESQELDFSNYWFETATPSFLIDYCKHNQFDLENALTNPVPASTFSAYEVDKIHPLALFFQTGYLTIKDSYEELGFTFYHLGYPNKEVQSSFEEKLLVAYTELPEGVSSQFSVNIVVSLKKGDVEAAMQLLKSFYAGFAFKLQEKKEHYYQAIFFAIFRSLGFSAYAESPTSDGSIDAVVKIDDWIYVFELKLDISAKKALEQIEEKDYYRKYIMTGKRIMLVGANFDSKTRQLTEWLFKEVKQ